MRGDSAYVNDTDAYIIATPRTITSSGIVEFNLTSKAYSGVMDMVWGFDTDFVKPMSAEYYSPYIENTTKSYTCNPPYWYNYTSSPNRFWCWKTVDYPANESNGWVESSLTTLVFEHDFETADLPMNTAYWTESVYKEWKDVSSSFGVTAYDYGGMDRWYYVKDVPVIAGKEYSIRALVELTPRRESYYGKYWFCAKPSALTIQKAVSQHKFYCLDPWYYYNFNDIGSSKLMGKSYNTTHFTAATANDFAVITAPTFAETFKPATAPKNGTQAGYVNLQSSNDARTDIQSGASGDEPYAYFNFTITRPVQDIRWLNVSVELSERSASTGTDEHCYYAIANFTGGTWFQFGAPIDGTTDLYRSFNFTSQADIAKIIDSRGVLSMLVWGTSMDSTAPGEGCRVDFAGVVLANEEGWWDADYGYRYPIQQLGNLSITYSINNTRLVKGVPVWGRADNNSYLYCDNTACSGTYVIGNTTTAANYEVEGGASYGLSNLYANYFADYHFNGTSALDATGNGHSCTYAGTANQITSAVYGKALEFDATTTDTCPSFDIPLASSFSVSFWLNATGATADDQHYFYSSEYGFYLTTGSADHSLYWGIHNAGWPVLPAGYFPAANSWDYYTFIHDCNAGYIYFYKNATQLNAPVAAACPRQAWAAANHVGQNVRGAMDELKVRTYAMSVNEMYAEFNNGKNYTAFGAVETYVSPSTTYSANVSQAISAQSAAGKSAGRRGSGTQAISAQSSTGKSYGASKSASEEVSFGGTGGGSGSYIKSPGTMADDATVGTVAWSNPDNAKVSDDVYATVDLADTTTTHYLKATNFGFSIPTGVTINGIFVEIEKKRAVGNGCSDNRISIVKADGTIGTTNKAIVGAWSTTESYVSYGSSSDLWGETWDDTKINDVDFGVVFSAKTSAIQDGDPYVDHIRITVYYTPAYISGISASAQLTGTRTGLQPLDMAGLASRLTDAFRRVPFAASLGAVVQRAGTMLKSLVQTLTIDTAAGRIYIGIRTALQSVSESFGLTKLFGYMRTVYGSLELRQAASLSLDSMRKLALSIWMSVSNSRIVSAARGVQQTVALNLGFGRIGELFKSAIQGISTEFSSGRTIALSRQPFQDISAVFSSSKLSATGRSVMQSLDIGAAVSRLSDAFRNPFQGASLTAMAERVSDASRSAMQHVNIGTLQSRTVLAFKSAMQYLDIGTNVGKMQTLMGSVMQYIGFDTLPARLQSSSRKLIQYLGFDNVIARIYEGVRSVSAGLCFGPMRPSVNASGLVGYWDMDEGAGNVAYDTSGNGNTGTLTNMNTTGNATSGWNSTDCKYGGCLRFDGVNDYVDAGDVAITNFDNGTSFTISAWIYQPTLSLSSIVAKEIASGAYKGYMLWVNTDGTLHIYIIHNITNMIEVSVSGVTAGGWQHVVATYDGSMRALGVNFYINGVNQTGRVVLSNSLSDTVANSYPFRIGARGTGTGFASMFNGTIDDFMVFDRALGADEVSVLYNYGYSSTGCQGGTVTRVVSAVRDASQSIEIATIASRLSEAVRSVMQYIRLEYMTARLSDAARMAFQGINFMTIAERVSDVFRSAAQYIDIRTSVGRLQETARSVMQYIRLEYMTARLSDAARTAFQSISMTASASRMADAFRNVMQYIRLDSMRSGLSEAVRSALQYIRLDTAASRTIDTLRNVFQPLSLRAAVVTVAELQRSIIQYIRLDSIAGRTIAVFRTAFSAISIETMAWRAKVFVASAMQDISAAFGSVIGLAMERGAYVAIRFASFRATLGRFLSTDVGQAFGLDVFAGKMTAASRSVAATIQTAFDRVLQVLCVSGGPCGINLPVIVKAVVRNIVCGFLKHINPTLDFCYDTESGQNYLILTPTDTETQPMPGPMPWLLIGMFIAVLLGAVGWSAMGGRKANIYAASANY